MWPLYWLHVRVIACQIHLESLLMNLTVSDSNFHDSSTTPWKMDTVLSDYVYYFLRCRHGRNLGHV